MYDEIEFPMQSGGSTLLTPHGFSRNADLRCFVGHSGR
jgi:hypothetical protein